MYPIASKEGIHKALPKIKGTYQERFAQAHQLVMLSPEMLYIQHHAKISSTATGIEEPAFLAHLAKNMASTFRHLVHHELPKGYKNPRLLTHHPMMKQYNGIIVHVDKGDNKQALTSLLNMHKEFKKQHNISSFSDKYQDIYPRLASYGGKVSSLEETQKSLPNEPHLHSPKIDPFYKRLHMLESTLWLKDQIKWPRENCDLKESVMNVLGHFTPYADRTVFESLNTNDLDISNPIRLLTTQPDKSNMKPFRFILAAIYQTQGFNCKAETLYSWVKSTISHPLTLPSINTIQEHIATQQFKGITNTSVKSALTNIANATDDEIRSWGREKQNKVATGLLSMEQPKQGEKDFWEIMSDIPDARHTIVRFNMLCGYSEPAQNFFKAKFKPLRTALHNEEGALFKLFTGWNHVNDLAKEVMLHTFFKECKQTLGLQNTQLNLIQEDGTCSGHYQYEGKNGHMHHNIRLDLEALPIKETHFSTYVDVIFHELTHLLETIERDLVDDHIDRLILNCYQALPHQTYIDCSNNQSAYEQHPSEMIANKMEEPGRWQANVSVPEESTPSVPGHL